MRDRCSGFAQGLCISLNLIVHLKRFVFPSGNNVEMQMKDRLSGGGAIELRNHDAVGRERLVDRPSDLLHRFDGCGDMSIVGVEQIRVDMMIAMKWMVKIILLKGPN